MESALATGADVISADSRLHNKNEILGNDEWNEALHFVSALGPITHKNWSLHLHIRRVAEFARRLSEELKGLNVSDFETLDPNTVRIQGLFHDIGKVAGQFGYLRTEYEGDAILKRLNMEHLAVDTVRLGNHFKTLDQLAPLEKLIMYADMCAGVDIKDPARIQTYDDRLATHERTRTLRNYTEYTGAMPVFPTELSGLRHLDEGDKDRYTALYRELDTYFKNLGIDRDAIQQQMMEEESNAPVQAVIFDVGGVLIPDPDAEDIASLTTTLGRSEKEIKNAWADLVPKLQTGEMTIETFWDAFTQKLGVEKPHNYRAFFGEKLQIVADPAIQSIVERIRSTGDCQLGILTNTVPPAMEKLKSLYKQFDVVTCSPDIGVTKGNPDPIAYYIAALKMNLPPQACVFIDNIETYVTNAKRARMKGVRFVLGDDIVSLEGALRENGVRI